MVHKSSVNYIFVSFFFLLALVIMTCAIDTFRGVFIIRKSYDCDSRLDCFPFESETNVALQEDSISNCSTFLSDRSVDIKCYQFAFYYVEGIGLVAGILVVSSFIIKAYVIMFTDHSSSTSVKQLGINKYLTIFSIVGIGLVIFVVMGFACAAFLETFYLKTQESAVQFITYWSILCCLTMITPLSMLLVKRYMPVLWQPAQESHSIDPPLPSIVNKETRSDVTTFQCEHSSVNNKCNELSIPLTDATLQ